ncbi:MAG TPA: ATP-binding protein [Arachidicoccus sp.]
MKLINKISIWFMAIVLLLTPVCVIISYNSIRNKIDNTQVERMKTMNNDVAQLIKTGEITNDYTLGKPIQIEKLSTPMPQKQIEIINGSHGEKNLDKNGYLLTVNSYYNINGNVYKITAYNYTTNSIEIFWSMIKGMVWKLVLISLAVIFTARYFSKKFFLPFRQSIRALNNFNLKDKTAIKLPETNIKEFKELNAFIKTMTNKVIEDYSKAKEFSENASHELQTPLAIVRTKMELLAETNINEQQADLIEDMQNAIEKLSSINRSLVLLSKLENQEFAQEQIKFCSMTRNVLNMYEDWISLRGICVTTKLDSNIMVNMHPSLAEILLANLISNAIRHNVVGGKLEIQLTAKMLRISNTGNPIDILPEDLFLRFKKGNQSSEGIGLGLSIVKQICEETNFKIKYDYENQQHIFNVYFEKEANNNISVVELRSEKEFVA